MAFQQSTKSSKPTLPITRIPQESNLHFPARSAVEESQEWILFSPTQAESSTHRTQRTQTAGLSRISDRGSLNTTARSGQLESEALEEDVADDAELDDLDEGLHAFQEPALFPVISHQSQHPVLPAHDGLGTFQASSSPVLEQLWQHEQFNPKRKHEGMHHRSSSVQRRLDKIEEIESQSNDEKRLRIEKWRLDQSEAMLEEVQRETRRRLRRESELQQSSTVTMDNMLGTTPTQNDYLHPLDEVTDENDSFWRRLTRRFIHDVIGIDEPLLSVILGESLPEEALEQPVVATLPTIPETPVEPKDTVDDDTWRGRLLQRIARELGVFVYQLSPYPGAFTTYAPQSRIADYAGMPVSVPEVSQTRASREAGQDQSQNTITSFMTPTFSPTMRNPTHAESWGFEEEPTQDSSALAESSLDLQREREYWEQQLDVKRVFRYVRDRFVRRASVTPTLSSEQRNAEDAARRAAIIRHHHPLVARAYGTSTRQRRDSRLSTRRPTSSCASESVKSSRKASVVRSGTSSRNYWDIGGSAGSGSIVASGGMMGAWAEA